MGEFNEYTTRALNIQIEFEKMLDEMRNEFGISFKSPAHDMARRFLNEIEEFKPLKEVIE